MTYENIQTQLKRFPILMFTMFYCAWLTTDHYAWISAPDSELGQRRTQVMAGKSDFEDLKKQLGAAQAFYGQLDMIRSRISALSFQLDSTKAEMSQDLDIAGLVQLISIQAHAAGLQLKSVRPGIETTGIYYNELPIRVSFTGVYVQALVLFDRLAKSNRVLRVVGFDSLPASSQVNRLVPLEWNVKLVSYRMAH